MFHTYSCYARGVDMMNTAYHYLDLVPKGRDETGAAAYDGVGEVSRSLRPLSGRRFAMSHKSTAKKLETYRRQIAGLREKMRTLQAAVEPEPVEDYAFATPDGTVRLSKLFGRKDDLIVIHNMGSSCPHCTLWADGFNGLYDHLANRAAFAVSSPDAPALQKKFAAGRGWRFPMVSHRGTSFAADMGYRSEDGGWIPASPCSGATTAASCASPTRASAPATISARSGTSSTSSPRVPASGRRGSATAERLGFQKASSALKLPAGTYSREPIHADGEDDRICRGAARGARRL